MTTAWPEVALGDICQFKYGKSMPASARSGLGFPVFGSNGEVGRHEDALTSGPTIVVGRKGSFGEVHLSESACWPIDTTYFIDESATSQDLRWLFYLLGTLGLTELNRAAAIPGLNRADAYRKRFPLPPLDEQRRIAAILDKADEVRAKRKAALETLETLSQAIFIEMFGDDACKRNGWDVKPIGEFVRIRNGFMFKSADFSEDGDLVIRISDLGQNFVQLDHTARIPREKAGRGTSFSLDRGDILISMSGSIGKVAVMPETNGCSVYQNQRIGKVEFMSDALLPSFALEFFRSEFFISRAKKLSAGVALSNLSGKQIESTPCPIPPIDLQEEFHTSVCGVNSARRLAEVQLKDQNYLFSSLRQKAFQGAL